MTPFVKPKAKHLESAFRDHGVNLVVDARERSRDQWANGLRAATVHHTAGKNSRNVLAERWNLPGANALIQHGGYNGKHVDGRAVILAWGSCWHTGEGGPWPGVAARDSLHLTSWGIEVESIGTRADMTDAQIQTVGRMLAALVDLGMPGGNIHRHADWTDGTGPVGGHPLPTVGRKIDTNKRFYDTAFWLDQARAHLAVDRTLVATPAKPGRRDRWDGVVPFFDALMVSHDGGFANDATWRLACRLADLGFYAGTPVRGRQQYPEKAVAAWQRARGYRPTGMWGPKAQKILFSA